MKIEINEKGSEAFYREVINITAQFKALLKQPERKLSDSFKSLKVYILIAAVMTGLTALMGFLWGFDTLTVAGIVMLLIVLLFSGAYLMSMNKVLKSYLADERASVLTIDEQGIELNKGDTQFVRNNWESIAFVRAFDESVAVLPKEVGGIVICIDKKYRQQVFEAVRQANPDVKLIG